MRLGYGIGVVFLLSLALAAPARATTVHLFDHALTLHLDGAAVAGTLPARVDAGGGAGAPMSPWIPCVASGLIPGLGQVLNGEIVKGVIFFAVVVGVSLIASATTPILGLVALAAWVYNVYDAYTVAEGKGGGGEVEPPVRVIPPPALSRGEEAGGLTLALVRF